jgi:hypothetical protein
MNYKKLVKITNTIGAVSILLLTYWVFIFLITSVFGLKVFKEQITESFLMSILAILALMVGSLFINIMLNLTRIAEKHETCLEEQPAKGSVTGPIRKQLIAVLVSFPIIALLLFGGNYLSTKYKEKVLIQSAKEIVTSNKENTSHLLSYEFDKKWIEKTAGILSIYSKIDKKFNDVMLIIPDTVSNIPLYLHFTNDDHIFNNDHFYKDNYILEIDQEEREYLNRVFKKRDIKSKFIAKDGFYELYYPFESNGKIVVFYFSDYQRFGKIGSK